MNEKAQTILICSGKVRVDLNLVVRNEIGKFYIEQAQAQAQAPNPGYRYKKVS
jgi:hypothetical protein